MRTNHSETVVKIHDNNTGQTATTTMDRVGWVLHGWMPDAPDEVRQVIAELQRKIDAGEGFEGELVYLDVNLQ